MAQMRPDLPSETLEFLPRSEAQFYRACREQLPERDLVYYSVRMLNESMVEGEADFVLFDPERGMLVIEVKGGGVSYDPDTGQWHSIDRKGIKHLVKDPGRQASDRMHDLRKLLINSSRWTRQIKSLPTCGYAVLFPDLSSSQVDRIKRLDLKRDILGCAADLKDLHAWTQRVFARWHKPGDVGPGTAGISVAKDMLGQQFEVQPLLSARLRHEEAVRMQLTDVQALLLEQLEERRRIAIAGGAGTGKTLLAIEQSRRQATQGRRTLLLCYNRPLADHLREINPSRDHIEAMTLHQLYEWWISWIEKQSGRNLLREANEQYPGRSRAEVQLPHAFLSCLDAFPPPSFDSVVVDEGQDFRDEDWLAIDVLVEKTGASLCIFHDRNQMLYRRSDYFPITDERDCFVLRRNCRNTRPIHSAAYRFYEGLPTREPAIEGEPIVHLEAPDRGAQARAIQHKVRSLLTSDGVQCDDLAVLVLGATMSTRSFYEELRALPIGSGVSWAEETHRQAQTVLLESVARFKGLERALIFLWLDDDFDIKAHQELLYVGMSRAKSRLFLVSSTAACQRAVQAIQQ